MVVQRIVLLEYPGVGSTPSAEAKLLCCFLKDKSILGVVVLEDSQSLVLCAGSWDNTQQVRKNSRSKTVLCLFTLLAGDS